MKIFHDLCNYLSKITSIEELYLYLLISSAIVIVFSLFVKKIGTVFFRKHLSGRREYVVNQAFKIIVNIAQIIVLLFISGVPMGFFIKIGRGL